MFPDQEVFFLFVKCGVCSQLGPQHLTIVITMAKMIKMVTMTIMTKMMANLIILAKMVMAKLSLKTSPLPHL